MFSTQLINKANTEEQSRLRKLNEDIKINSDFIEKKLQTLDLDQGVYDGIMRYTSPAPNNLLYVPNDETERYAAHKKIFADALRVLEKNGLLTPINCTATFFKGPSLDPHFPANCLLILDNVKPFSLLTQPNLDLLNNDKDSEQSIVRIRILRSIYLFQCLKKSKEENQLYENTFKKLISFTTPEEFKNFLMKIQERSNIENYFRNNHLPPQEITNALWAIGHQAKLNNVDLSSNLFGLGSNHASRGTSIPNMSPPSPTNT